MKSVSALVAAALIANGSFGAQTLMEAFEEGIFKGHIRLFYIDRSWQGDLADLKTDYDAKAAAIDLHYETAPWRGWSAGVTMYSDNDFGLNSSDIKKVHTSILGDDGESFSFVGEAYGKYHHQNTTFKAGRQKISTPLLAPDDARTIPTLFSGYLLTNTDLPHTTITAAHITHIAPGTFFNQYRNPHKHALVLTAGYGANADASIGEFHDIGWYTVGEQTDGVSFVGIINRSIPDLTLQIWDYYAHDILNALYIEGIYRFDTQYSPYIALQYINEKDVGDALLKNLEDIPTGEIDANYYGIKIGATFGNLSAYAAYSSCDSSKDTALHGSIISAWGGMPAYTQGMVTRHQFLADTTAWKVAGVYKWESGLKSALYYASFDVGSLNPYSPGHDWTAREAGFDLIYYPVKDLQLRFRGNFPRKFYENAQGEDLGWDEFRLIVNYYF
ncbi:MAG: OprD family porin [Epsilonproteobacteria bacterium]|nr:OprD family porin [Campylobacterota bacterium]